MSRIMIGEEDLGFLVSSVNVKRKRKNPVVFDKKELYDLYKSID